MPWPRRPLPALSAMLLVVLAGGPMAACTSPTEELPELAEVTTTTDPDAAADLEPPPSPDPAPEVAARLAAAAAGDDFCALVDAIDSTAPDVDDVAGAVVVYDALAAATSAARGIVPPELREPWEDVVAGTAAAAAAVQASGGDQGDPDVTAALESRDMVVAAQEIERYQMQQCPPPVP